MSRKAIPTSEPPACGMTALSIRSTRARCWACAWTWPWPFPCARATLRCIGCEARMKTLPSVIVESVHAVGHVTLNRPDRRNVYDGRLIAALHTAFEQIGKDGSVRVVVLTGA